MAQRRTGVRYLLDSALLEPQVVGLANADRRLDVDGARDAVDGERRPPPQTMR